MGVPKTSITARASTWNPAHGIRFSVQFWTGDLSKMYPVKLNTILFVQYVAFFAYCIYYEETVYGEMPYGKISVRKCPGGHVRWEKTKGICPRGKLTKTANNYTFRIKLYNVGMITHAVPN